jgi:hypothetical protein
MSWSPDQTKPAQLDQRSATATKRAEHPARAIMTRRWEEKLARKNTLSEPTISGVQRVPTRSDEAGEPNSARGRELSGSLPPLLNSPLAHVPAANSGDDGDDRPKRAWITNPQRALLVVAAMGCTALLAVLYFGGFFG